MAPGSGAAQGATHGAAADTVIHPKGMSDPGYATTQGSAWTTLARLSTTCGSN
jgi:hypothetical protein